MTKKPHAVVIIPTYNEAGNIGNVVAALSEVFPKISDWQMSILVVDDNSPDGTADIVRKLAKKHSYVNLLLNKNKLGLGAAYLKGMDEAFHKHNADVVFEFDADLSHDPTKIPLFLEKIDAGYDLVLGSRYRKGGGIPQDWGLHRKFLSMGGNLFIMFLLTDFRIRDWTSGYRAITKKVYESVASEMKSERFHGYAFQIGFLHKTVRKGFSVAEIPYKFIDRTEGHSKLGPEYIKNNLIYLLKIRFEEIVNHRIFKFAMVGGLGALVQLLSLQIWRNMFPFQLAFFLAVETAVLSNFVLNNIWTFADRKLSLAQAPFKFIQFNIASSGSIIIQQLIALIGEFTIGLVPIFTLPIIGFTLDTGTIYAVLGILLGMFWNFFAYNKFIWKK